MACVCGCVFFVSLLFHSDAQLPLSPQSAMSLEFTAADEDLFFAWRGVMCHSNNDSWAQSAVVEKGSLSHVGASSMSSAILKKRGDTWTVAPAPATSAPSRGQRRHQGASAAHPWVPVTVHMDFISQLGPLRLHEIRQGRTQRQGHLPFIRKAGPQRFPTLCHGEL